MTGLYYYSSTNKCNGKRSFFMSHFFSVEHVKFLLLLKQIRSVSVENLTLIINSDACSVGPHDS